MRIAVCVALVVASQFIAKDRLTGTATTPTGVPLSCADATTRCVPSEYATIQACNNAANAGDVCWITAGTYVETVTFNHSGTSGNPVTYLASGTVTFCGGTFASQSYIRLVGVTIDRSTGGCASGHGVSGTGTNTGLEFWHVTVQNTSGNKGYSFDRGIGANQCVSCIVLGGAITGVGNPSATTAMLISGNDSFVGYINFSTICYIGIGPSGSRLRMVNNNFSGMIQCGVSHPDFYYISTDTNGYSTSLIESTYGIGTPTASDNKGMHSQNQSASAWVDDVWRFNVNYNLGAGYFSMYGDSSAITRWRLYHNTLVNCVRAQSGVAGCGNISTVLGPAVSASLFNNLVYQGWSDNVTSNVLGDTETGGSPTITKDYNLAYDPDGNVTFASAWTNQAHEQSNVNPLFVNAASDWTLQSGSGARGVGGPLTTATSCSGTTLNVASGTGSFFIGDNSSNLPQYGGKLVPGDTVTVNSTQYTVSSISSDALTLASSISCSNGDPVYFGDSTNIDIGAYPYKAGGYALSATKAQVGSTVTITPNDATLARFAVVYENGIPKCVASAGNSWACSVGSGVITAYIYPRYASATQRVLVN